MWYVYEIDEGRRLCMGFGETRETAYADAALRYDDPLMTSERLIARSDVICIFEER